MIEFFDNEVLVLALTLGVFYLSQQVYQKLKWALFHPVLLSVGILIVILLLADVDYSLYKEHSHMIDFFLAPSVVALGVVLYEQVHHVRKNVLAILVSLFVGSFVGILSACGVAWLLGADQVLIATLAPKSVTTPIAMSVVEQIGGIPSLVAVIVIAVGILGAAIGPFILKLLNVNSRMAIGLALGASAHGIGTSKALELGALEGAVGGLAIGLMGVMTSFLVPLIYGWFI
ncbi:LrgB family protein [Limibacter armeniacum]|uniref:LrgB family protein n=1 Tax=Limibacter armeniacum TaxID=466084 RepID=UPI002FE51F1B